jgi:hypothetical protein
MNHEELDRYLKDNSNTVEWKDDEKGIIFRHTVYDKPEEGVHIEFKKLRQITPPQLDQILVNGRNVECITRITGYFSKVSGWNKGKIGELHDRTKASDI